MLQWPKSALTVLVPVLYQQVYPPPVDTFGRSWRHGNALPDLVTVRCLADADTLRKASAGVRFTQIFFCASSAGTRLRTVSMYPGLIALMNFPALGGRCRLPSIFIIDCKGQCTKGKKTYVKGSAVDCRAMWSPFYAFVSA